jgi:hypothetical protein
MLLDILEDGRDLGKDGLLTVNEIGPKLGVEVARYIKGTCQRPVFGVAELDFLFKISRS